MKRNVLGGLFITMLVFFVYIQLDIEDVDVHVVRGTHDFDWLRNLNFLPQFVHPDNDTELFIPLNLSDTVERHFIACFVLSAPKNMPARTAIRQTWGSVIKPLFVIGKSDVETNRLVISEANLFDDIIVEDFIDVYLNLTLKTAFAMKHFLRHFPNSTFFFKIDDDVYLNVDNLKSMIRDKGTPKNAIIGHLVPRAKPQRSRESKFYLPFWLYEADFFPPYHDGPAYLIPGLFCISSAADMLLKLETFRPSQAT